MGESRDQTHPATYAPAGSSRGACGSNEVREALGVKGPKKRKRVSERAGRNGNEHRASPETMRCGRRPRFNTGKAAIGFTVSSSLLNNVPFAA